MCLPPEDLQVMLVTSLKKKSNSCNSAGRGFISPLLRLQSMGLKKRKRTFLLSNQAGGLRKLHDLKRDEHHKAFLSIASLLPFINSACFLFFLIIIGFSESHLAVTDHDHADEDDVDVGAQGFIVVDLIHLRGRK